MADTEISKEQAEAEKLQKDVEGFNAKLIPILGEFNLGLGASAFLTPDGKIGARPTLFRAPAAPEKKVADKAEAAPATPSAPAAPPASLDSSEA
jgi:hypothetical protein